MKSTFPPSVALVLVVSCAHGIDPIATADADLHNRDYQGALRGYRDAVASECAGGDAARCCRGLIGEGESLLQLQDRQAAIAAFERARASCPTDLEVRRKLYLAKHAGAQEPAGSASRVTFAREHELRHLGWRAKVVWLGLFLDGVFVGREPFALAPGNHELEAEAFVEVKGSEKSPRRLRLSARQPVAGPTEAGAADLKGRVRLTISDRGDASQPADRMVFTMQLWAPTPADQAAAARAAKPLDPVILDQHAGLELRVSGAPPRGSPEQLRKSAGQKIHAEICIGRNGRVESINFPNPSPAHDPSVDAAVLEALRNWRYGTYKVDGEAQAFCHIMAVGLDELRSPEKSPQRSKAPKKPARTRNR